MNRKKTDKERIEKSKIKHNIYFIAGLFVIFVLILVSLFFDKRIIGFISAHQYNFVYSFFYYFDFVSVAILIFLFYINFRDVIKKKNKNKREKKKFLFSIISFAVSLIVCHLLKFGFSRQRPENIAIGYAFPSGHATAMSSIVSFLKKNITIFWVIVASISLFGRIYVMAHYLSDILGGLLVGLIFNFIFYHLTE